MTDLGVGDSKIYAAVLRKSPYSNFRDSVAEIHQNPAEDHGRKPVGESG